MTAVSRRRFLTTAAAAFPLSRFSFAGVLHDAPPCTLTPEQEVGPFYVADELLRTSIHEGKPGTPLHLNIRLLDARTCRPLPAAAIDLWHCDAAGIYSGYTKASQQMGGPGGPGGPEGGPNGRPPDFMGGPGGPGGPPAMKPTDKLTFCRGIQITDAEGAVRFETIVPGFYQGRTNHIHLKVRLDGHTGSHTYSAGHTAHTGQIFFPEDLLIPLMKAEPYASHHIHRTTPAEDGPFRSQHGATSMATLLNPHPESPWTATITLTVDPTATPKPVDGFPGGPPPRT